MMYNEEVEVFSQALFAPRETIGTMSLLLKQNGAQTNIQTQCNVSRKSKIQLRKS